MKKNPRMKVLGDLEELFEGRLAGKLSAKKPQAELEGEGDVPIDPKDLGEGSSHKAPKMKNFLADDQPPGSEEGGDPKPFLEQQEEESEPLPGEHELDIEKLTPEEQQLLEKLYNKMCGEESEDGEADSFQPKEDLA